MKYSIPAGLAMALCAVTAWAADGGHVVLNETCYLRQYYRFGVNRYSATALANEGEKVLGRTGLSRIRRDTEKEMAQSGIDPAKADWREHVVQPMYESYRPALAEPPPGEWTGVGFDDSGWVLARGPFQAGRPAGITNPGAGAV